MSFWLKVFLLSLLSTCHCLLIVQKSFKESVFIRNTNLTVRITITNRGPLLATDLLLHDQTFNNASAFSIVSGKNYVKVPDLPVNKSFTTRFVVLPKISGVIKGYPAVVKYASGDQKYTAYSSFKSLVVAPFSATQSVIVSFLSKKNRINGSLLLPFCQ